MDGAFGDGNRWEWEITDAHTFDGEDIDPGDLLERLDEVDEVFYHVHDTRTDEDFYRWVGGPFADFEGLAESIADQESEYAEVSS